MTEYWYFRDHENGGWGVKRGQAGAADGETLLTGLDKSVAHAISLLLAGKVRQAVDLLGVFRSLPEDAVILQRDTAAR